MSDKLIISNVDNYNKTFEFTDTKTYVLRYVELINEYMLYVVENMIIQDDTYLLFLIRRGVETIMHCFKFLLMYTKNLELTVYQCKKALYYYIEFIGQISDVSLHHSYLQPYLAALSLLVLFTVSSSHIQYVEISMFT